jgi:hypothetical protein
MKTLRMAAGKIVAGVFAVGLVLGLLIWSGTLSKNDAVHVAVNGGNAVGYGSGVTVVGLGSAVRGLGDAIKTAQADHAGTDKVPAKP